ncbi:hypothetical protein QE364_000782 [Nocardioides zeae]|uniref:Uncharacterized protein n=1 Tax=Nocardioides zeae TaxID=1457234 RepID=A0ACC6IEA6_9ACTN|nr:DUF6301 family protein [Nocardioides zeae]MDR6174285.1 hypothetical protein [Nocardioides zeae]MDR6209090.1 hypothetical protein [Nocardioides zeae]
MTECDAFTDDLVAALRTVGDRVVLIVAARDDDLAYVQFAGGPDDVTAEASGTHAGARTGLLADHGWQPPRRGEANWLSPFLVPATTAELRALAERCVAALRVAYGIKSPADLTYNAWREPQPAPRGVTWPKKRYDDLDPGEDPLRFRDLEPDHAAPTAPTEAEQRAWTAMAPDDVVHVLAHWATQAWPLAEDAAYDVAIRLGWEIEVEDGKRYVVNRAGGLTVPDVSVEKRRGQLKRVRLWTTDAIRDVSRDFVAFLGDAFAASAAAGTTRWGPSTDAEVRRDNPLSRTRHWTLPNGARIGMSLSAKSVTAEVMSPQGVAWQRQDDDNYYAGY